jgi:hypothetical protein
VFAGELTTRHFNFKHEWGMELIYYLVLSRTVPHLPADLLLRDDWLAWRRSGSLYRGLAASLIATTLASLFGADRAYLATACDGNADGGGLRDAARPVAVPPPRLFCLGKLARRLRDGWAIAGVYYTEALGRRNQGKALADERKLWVASAVAVLAFHR